MRSLKRLALGSLITWSLLCGAAAANVLLDPNVTPESRRGILVASSVLGGLGLLGSGAIATRLKRDRHNQMQTQLNRTFKHQLSTGQGQIALMPFALKAQVSATTAQAFLNQQAQQFDSEFTVTERGEILYNFQRSLTIPADS